MNLDIGSCYWGHLRVNQLVLLCALLGGCGNDAVENGSEAKAIVRKETADRVQNNDSDAGTNKITKNGTNATQYRSFSIPEGELVGRKGCEEAKGVALYIGNQSQELIEIDIELKIDGEEVVTDMFQTYSQRLGKWSKLTGGHQEKEYRYVICKGEHQINASSRKADYQQHTQIVIGEATGHIAVFFNSGVLEGETQNRKQFSIFTGIGKLWGEQ